MKTLQSLAVPLFLLSLSAFVGFLVSWGTIKSEAKTIQEKVLVIESKAASLESRQALTDVSIAELKKDITYIRQGIDDLRSRP